jgi:hypothetical protein
MAMGARARTLRIAADVVTAALGLNLWLSLVLVPGLFLGSFGPAALHGRAFLALTPVPLFVLAIGIARRSPVWLLLAYPASLLAPVALDPRTVGENAQRPLAFVLIAASLVGFFLGSAYLTGARNVIATEMGRTRRLGASLGTKNPVRWRRRRRIYAALGIVSLVFPVALLYQINFAPDTRAYLAEMYPGARAPSMVALLDLAAVGLWLCIFSIAVVGPLRSHRTGDKELITDLERLRLEAARPAPTLAFYVGVVCALGLMALLLYLRSLGH